MIRMFCQYRLANVDGVSELFALQMAQGQFVTNDPVTSIGQFPGAFEMEGGIFEWLLLL